MIALTIQDMTELQADYTAACTRYSALADKKVTGTGMALLTGYGISLRVKNNALIMQQGKMTQEEQPITILYRGTHAIHTIIILAEKGIVTLDAISWCEQQHISIVMINNRGELTSAITPEHESSPMLRRSQYRALDSHISGVIACELVKRKIAAQLETLHQHPELPTQHRACEIIFQALAWFNLSTLPDRYYDVAFLMQIEARVASVYYGTLQDASIKWDKATAKTIPPHWKVLTSRTSPLSHNHGARHAVNPFHACLNYLYAVLESQVRQALTSAGFDTTCGFLHALKEHRDSLVYDVIEEFRPLVDHLLLKFFSKTTFKKGDFIQRPDGSISINPELCRYLIASCKLPQPAIDTSVTRLSLMLAQDQGEAGIGTENKCAHIA